MGRFVSTFRKVDADTEQRLRAEAWKLFATRVDELIASGKGHTEAESIAFADTSKAFKARHPELSFDMWGFELVQP